MTEKVAASAKQFKILDVDSRKELNDRKELINTAKKNVCSETSLTGGPGSIVRWVHPRDATCCPEANG
jgi:hypothetical protein